MKKEILKIGLKFIAFSLIGFGIMLLLNNILLPTTEYTKAMKDFYDEPKNSLDVVFFGDSGVYKGITPMKIWKDYGITSYDFGSPIQRIWDSYYCIKEVEKYQKPKVIVLDVNQFFADKPSRKTYRSHLYDNMRWGIPKVEGIIDPIQKDTKKEQLSYLMPGIKFHSRWSELDETDFVSYKKSFTRVFKGYRIGLGKKPYKGKVNAPKSDNDEINDSVKPYLEKIKDIAKKNDAEILLISLPTPKVWTKLKSENVEKWAEENQCLFVDFNYMEELGINWKKDTSDKGDHLNLYGANKVTSYLGEYLSQNYNLKDHRGEEKYKQWDVELEKYENYISENTK